MLIRSLILISVFCGAPAVAEGFKQVTDRSSFVSLIQGRDLTRLGVRLFVTASGGIGGRAFGRSVDGTWTWRDGYFCREIIAGSTTVPMNCQMVLRAGETLRFVSDRGRGEYADLRLD
jgi:hypothetical protein